MTNVQLLKQFVAGPRRFFAELAETPRFALPLWALVLSTCALFYWFYSIANVEWLIEQQLSASPRAAAMTDEQREAAARFTTRGFLTWSSIISVFVLLFVLRLLETVWYLVTVRGAGQRRTFRQWFAFSWWTSLPAVIAVVPSALLLLLAEGSPTDVGILQPLSLNELFFHRKMSEPGYQVLSSVSPLLVVTLGLAVYGLKCWTGRAWAACVVIGVLPTVLLVTAALLLPIPT